MTRYLRRSRGPLSYGQYQRFLEEKNAMRRDQLTDLIRTEIHHRV